MSRLTVIHAHDAGGEVVLNAQLLMGHLTSNHTCEPEAAIPSRRARGSLSDCVARGHPIKGT